ncbi:hypothetical protein V8C86DRAFT_581069 [Haematococcus lacustris]
MKLSPTRVRLPPATRIHWLVCLYQCFMFVMPLSNQASSLLALLMPLPGACLPCCVPLHIFMLISIRHQAHPTADTDWHDGHTTSYCFYATDVL